MFSYRFGMLLLIGALLLTMVPAHAQENEVVTATVAVPTLNVRNAPNAWPNDADTLIGQLHAGDVVTVHQYEQVDGWNWEELTWVYVTHDASGLTGWVAGNYMTFSRPDWRAILPHADTWAALAYEVGMQFPIPFESAANGGGSSTHVHALPTGDSEVIGSIPNNAPIWVHGSGRINGKLMMYVYVEYPDGNLKGWIHSYLVQFPIFFLSFYQRIWRSGGWVAALPVIYDRDVESEFTDYPQAVLNNNAPLHLRSAPSLDAPIINAFYYEQGLEVAVQARTTHDFEGWAYITILRSGVTGWIYDPADNSFLLYEDPSARNNLPILQP
ncbi:MAG: SH3 domain-containing protein [Anaerolineae bacterium]|nr:SH3 domain-containing protein [Anaerolineae bacterium]